MSIYAIVIETQDGLKVKKSDEYNWHRLLHLNRKAYDLGQITLYLSRPKHIPEHKALAAAMDFFQNERRKLVG